MCALVLISPATTHRPVVTSVSHATRPYGSSARTASRTLSLIWSAILSGWPSVTDSDVNVCLLTNCSSSATVASTVAHARRTAGRSGPPSSATTRSSTTPASASFVSSGSLLDARRRRRAAAPGSCRPRTRRRRALTSLATMRSTRLAASFAAACSPHALGLGREADDDLAGALARAERGEDVDGRLEHDLGDAVALLQLLGGDRLGPEVGDRRGHDHRVGRRRRGPCTASCISSAVSTAHDLDAGGDRPVGGGDQHDRARPAPRATSAIAWPIFPDDRLPTKRTGSIGSRVPPAVTSTVRPDSGPASDAEELRARASTMRSGSASRPGADVAAGEAAGLGFEHVHAAPRAASRGSPAPPRAPTSRCASPGTRAPARGSRAASR